MKIISDKAKISSLADLEDSVRGSKLIIHDDVSIDSFVKIKFAGGAGNVEIGRNSHLTSGVVIHSGDGVKIGEDVLISPNCTLSGGSHEYRSKGKTIYDQRFMPSKGGIIIEDDVWIGANTVILDGSVIRKGAVIAAHSLVMGELESYGIFVGSPLKLISKRK